LFFLRRPPRRIDIRKRANTNLMDAALVLGLRGLRGGGDFRGLPFRAGGARVAFVEHLEHRIEEQSLQTDPQHQKRDDLHHKGKVWQKGQHFRLDYRFCRERATAPRATGAARWRELWNEPKSSFASDRRSTLLDGLRWQADRAGSAFLFWKQRNFLVRFFRPVIGGPPHGTVSLEHHALVNHQARSGDVPSQLPRGAQLDAFAAVDVTDHFPFDDDRTSTDMRVDDRGVADNNRVLR